MTQGQLRILLVDDHEVVRRGLRALFDQREEFLVVGEAGSVAEAIAEADRSVPDVVIMDVRLPDGSGVEACREVRAAHSEMRVIMLTSYADDEAVFNSIMAGASGYLLKQVRARDLLTAVEAVGKGNSLLDPAVTQKVLERMRGTFKAQEGASLSEQEEKVLALIAEGRTNKEIAQQLFLSDKTIKNYVSSILDKLSLRRRAEAAAYFVRKHRQDDMPG